MLEINNNTLDKRKAALHALNNDVQAFALILDYLNQCSIYCFNSWGASDALSDRTSNANLIKRLEELSTLADALNDEAKAKSKALRAELRPLMKQIKSADEMREVTTLSAIQDKKEAEPPALQPAPKATKPTKKQLVEQAKAEIAVKPAKAKMTVKAKAKTAK